MVTTRSSAASSSSTTARATSSADQTARLKIIAAELAGKPQVVEVLGHASRRPLPSGSSYRDRCDLAFARCRQTVELLRACKIDTTRMWIGVVETSGSATSGDAAGPGEDSQVDIYLTDLLPEKYISASSSPEGVAR